MITKIIAITIMVICVVCFLIITRRISNTLSEQQDNIDRLNFESSEYKKTLNDDITYVEEALKDILQKLEKYK